MFYSGYFCDKCGTAIEYRRENKEWLPSKVYLVEYARKAGWSVGKMSCVLNAEKEEAKRHDNTIYDTG